MKIFDCTNFFNEDMMYGLRLKILDKYIDKFVVAESRYSHSGEPKKLNFNIDLYPEFKDRIQTILENLNRRIFRTCNRFLFKFTYYFCI